RTAKASTKKSVDDGGGRYDFRPEVRPIGSVVDNVDRIACVAPAREIRGRIATDLLGTAKEKHTRGDGFILEISGHHETVAAVVAFAAENGHASVFARGDDPPHGVRAFPSGGLHQLQLGNAVALGGEAVDLAHFGSAESFHVRRTTGITLEHPAARDIDDLSGDVLGFFGREKGDSGGDVVDRRRAADGKAGVLDAARLAKAELVLVDAGGVDDVNGDSVLGFLESQGAGECYDRCFGGGICGDFGLSKGALGTDGSHINDAAPAALAHVWERGTA